MKQKIIQTRKRNIKPEISDNELSKSEKQFYENMKLHYACERTIAIYLLICSLISGIGFGTLAYRNIRLYENQTSITVKILEIGDAEKGNKPDTFILPIKVACNGKTYSYCPTDNAQKTISMIQNIKVGDEIEVKYNTEKNEIMVVKRSDAAAYIVLSVLSIMAVFLSLLYYQAYNIR